MFNRETFFGIIRRTVVKKGLTQSQVDGFNLLLDYIEKNDVPINDAAYVLGTTWHETDRKVQPIREYGKGRGRSYGRPDPLTGQTYYGRGYVQLTWKRNYELASKKLGVDFVNNPDKVMEPQYALPILFTGMKEGWFTGKDLDDYIDDIDEEDKEDLREYINARRIVNGTDVNHWIGSLALKFEEALRAAYVVNKKPIEESRIVKGSATAGAGLLIVLIEPFQDLVGKVMTHQVDLFSGDAALVAAGIIGIGGAMYALYARWDDAGRPFPWRRGTTTIDGPHNFCPNCGEEL